MPSIGWDGNTAQASFGEVPTALDVGSWKYGLRGAYRHKLERMWEWLVNSFADTRRS